MQKPASVMDGFFAYNAEGSPHLKHILIAWTEVKWQFVVHNIFRTSSVQ